ncbi:MAG: helix-turn-helix domain-containing protein [Gemmatimonadales bacterium]
MRAQKDAVSIAGFRISEKRYPPATVLPRHTHGEAVICVVLDGGGQESIAGRIFELVPRCIFFRPAGHQHTNHFGSVGARALITELPAEWLDHIREASCFASEPLSLESERAWWPALRLGREYRRGPRANPLMVEGLMLEIAAAAERQELPAADKAPAWLRLAMDALHAHYRHQLPLPTLAGWAGVHPVHLARGFRRHCGCTVGEYTRRLRVDAARQQLTGSDTAISHIALDVGFANQAHLSRHFKALIGVSPAKYRAATRGR